MDHTSMLPKALGILKLVSFFNITSAILKTFYLIDGDMIMAPGFDLAESISSIDLFNAKMDRGLLRYHDMDLWSFRQLARVELFPNSLYAVSHPPKEFIIAVGRHLERLFFTCLNDTPAMDTLGTALILQFPSVIRCDLLIYHLETMLQLAHTVGDIICKGVVVKPDEFAPSYFSLVEEYSDAFANAFPHHEGQFDEWPDQYGTDLCEQLKLFELVNKTLRTLLEWEENKISELAHRLGTLKEYLNTQSAILNDGNTRKFDREKDLFIIPIMANVHTTGCVRRIAELLDTKTISNYLQEFIERLQRFINLVTLSPPYCHNAIARQLIEEASNTRLEGPLPFHAMLRASYHIILSHNIFNQHSIQPFSYCPRVVGGTLHILCCSLSRQRRSIHNLLSLHYTTDYRFLYLWYVLTGFGLDLYGPAEWIEAHWIVNHLAPSNSSLANRAHQLFMATPHPETQAAPTSPYDVNRFEHRWEFSPTLQFHHEYYLDLSHKSKHDKNLADNPRNNLYYFGEYVLLFMELNVHTEFEEESLYT